MQPIHKKKKSLSNLECNLRPVNLVLEVGRMRLFSLPLRQCDRQGLLTGSIHIIRSAPRIGLAVRQRRDVRSKETESQW